MTTRPPVMPRPAAKTQYAPNNDYYLTPDQATGMRKYGKPAVPRIQTMPPTSEEIGIYSYLDQENMDDHYIAKTLEAIESGEFFDVPQEIMTWYNSIGQDDEFWNEDKDEMKQQMFGISPSRYEYIDVNNDRTTPSEDYEEVRISFKQNKRFVKGEKMNFLKDRLNQFINSNFTGINKKRQVTKSPQAVSVSEPIEKYCGGVLVTSNSFDNSVSSLEYIENPKRRSSTEMLISQMPQGPAPAKDDNWYFYLEGSKSLKNHNKLTRQTSKSLENVFIPAQPPTPTPTPLDRMVRVEEDPYLVPLRVCKPAPIPPPRVSSRVLDPSRGSGYNENLTQDYVEPSTLTERPKAKTSTPICESPKVNPPHQRNLSTGSRPATEYILPEDEPLTPMTRFNTDSSVKSIPVLSPAEDYNDPRDFRLNEIRHEPVKYRPRQPEACKPHIQPKPPLTPKPLVNGQFSKKPTPPPKPRVQAPIKPNKPRFLTQNSAPRPADSHARIGSYRV